MMWDGFGGMGWGWIGVGMVHMLLSLPARSTSSRSATRAAS
jgi:hypothetical protein